MIAEALKQRPARAFSPVSWLGPATRDLPLPTREVRVAGTMLATTQKEKPVPARPDLIGTPPKTPVAE
jgi:hypothetical protein